MTYAGKLGELLDQGYLVEGKGNDEAKAIKKDLCLTTYCGASP